MFRSGNVSPSEWCRRHVRFRPYPTWGWYKTGRSSFLGAVLLFPPFVLVMSVEKSSFHPLGARKKSISGKLPSRFNLSRFAYVEVSLTYMPHIKKKCNQLDPSYRVCDLHSPFMFLFGCFVQVVPSFAFRILFLITFFLTISGYNNFLLSIFNSLRNKIPRTA